MRRTLVSLGLVCLLAVAVVGAEFAVSSWMSFELMSSGQCTIGGEPHRQSWFQNPIAVLDVEYSEGDWTLGMSTAFGIQGLTTLTAGVRGVLGAFDFASFMEFGGSAVTYDCPAPTRYTPMGDARQTTHRPPRFVNWKFLAWTSIAGVDVWALGGIDAARGLAFTQQIARFTPMDDCGNDCPAAGTSSTFGYGLGAHWAAGDLEIWIDVDFGAGRIGDDLRAGYDMDLIASTMYYCDWFQIRGEPCEGTFSRLDFTVEFPFGCADVWARLRMYCEGFESATFGVKDIQLGNSWLWVDNFTINFDVWHIEGEPQKHEKLWTVDLNLVIPEVLCIQPYIAFDHDLRNDWFPGGGPQTGSFVIDSIKLVGLKFETTWNGITFRAVERLDPDFATITTDARLWWTSEEETSYYEERWIAGEPGLSGCQQVCLQPVDVDEAFAIEVDGDACCGGALSGGMYVFFDHGLKDESLFDWFETRAVVKMGIGPSFDLGMEACFNYNRRSPVFKFSFGYSWGKLRMFKWPWFFNCFNCNVATNQ